jgi:uncharacterized protein
MAKFAISADSHIVEPAEVFAGLADRFGDEAPRVVSTDRLTDVIMVPARNQHGASSGQIGIAGIRLHPELPLERREFHKPAVHDWRNPIVVDTVNQGYQGLRRGIRDSRFRHEEQDPDHVTAEVLYPSYFAMFGFQNTELIEACFRNYNDWMANYCSALPGRLYGLALIPLYDPEAGAAELARVIKMGYRGACIPCTAPVGRPYRDACYEPIWAMAEEAGIPLSLHVGTNSYVPAEYRQKQLTRDPIADYTGAASSIQRTLSELICQGVAHRRPALKFVVAEFNCGWIAHWLDRLDQGYVRSQQSASPDLDRRPSEYWRGQFYATLEDDRAGILTREMIGVETLLWGNDYPHLDSTWPCSSDVRLEILGDIPEADVLAMTIHNAAKLYGIDPQPALAAA